MSDAERCRTFDLQRVLRALALGEVDSETLTDACLAAIGRDHGLHAWAHVDADGAREAARASDERRVANGAIGRLDGVPVALGDGFDVERLPTRVGLAGGGERPAVGDSAVASRLRGAGAVLLGKTSLDEAALGTLGRNPHGGDIGNPHLPGRVAGGAEGGAAAAVAAGHAVAAIGADTLGSVRVPAAFCGLVGLKPTFGEVSCRGLAPLLRRLDCPGILTRSVADAAVLLQVLAGYDPGDPRTRARRVPFAPPDWEPGRLRVATVSDLRTLGAAPEVVERFDAALQAAGAVLGNAMPMAMDVEPAEIQAGRRAALLLMQAEVLATHGDALEHASPRLRALLDEARGRGVADYVRADRVLDEAVVRIRARFEAVDVLVLPTAPSAPPARGVDEAAHLTDFTALASLAGCPALSLPLGEGIGLQLVGPRGSDLRLLELGEILAAVLDAGAA